MADSTTQELVKKDEETASSEISVCDEFRITGACVLSESGKVECVVSFPESPRLYVSTLSVSQNPNQKSPREEQGDTPDELDKPSAELTENEKVDIAQTSDNATVASSVDEPLHPTLDMKAEVSETPKYEDSSDVAEKPVDEVPTEAPSSITGENPGQSDLDSSLVYSAEVRVEHTNTQELDNASTADLSKESVSLPPMVKITGEKVEGKLKNKLEEIINEIDINESFVHRKTQYEDIVPIEIPDVKLKEAEKPPEPAMPVAQREPKVLPAAIPPVPKIIIPVNPTSNGEVSSPIEIPEGIPLLARILPKEEDRPERKIPLERLFTPATDSGEITPRRRKVFASSSFYRPDHPTMDDQVELAQKISFSLVDENNKMSRGQSMYIKRKKRSAKWVHEADFGAPMEVEEEEDVDAKLFKEKPPMKLLMNPKGVQDFVAVQQHYEELMSTQSSSLEASGSIVTTEVESPTGKGATMFAKRKKRMDQFIVDETTLQKQSSLTSTESTSFVSQTSESTTSSMSQSSSSQETNIIGLAHLPDLSKILTEVNSPNSPKIQNKSFPACPKTNFKTTNKMEIKSTFKRDQKTSSYSHFDKALKRNSYSIHSPPMLPLPSETPSDCSARKNDPLLGLRPGSPPVFVNPDGTIRKEPQAEISSAKLGITSKGDSNLHSKKWLKSKSVNSTATSNYSASSPITPLPTSTNANKDFSGIVQTATCNLPTGMPPQIALHECNEGILKMSSSIPEPSIPQLTPTSILSTNIMKDNASLNYNYCCNTSAANMHTTCSLIEKSKNFAELVADNSGKSVEPLDMVSQCLFDLRHISQTDSISHLDFNSTKVNRATKAFETPTYTNLQTNTNNTSVSPAAQSLTEDEYFHKLLPQSCSLNDACNNENNTPKDMCNKEPVIIIPEVVESVCSDDDLSSFISEMERSLSATPIMIDTISVDDLESPDFFRSISRNEDNNTEIQDKINENHFLLDSQSSILPTHFTHQHDFSTFNQSDTRALTKYFGILDYGDLTFSNNERTPSLSFENPKLCSQYHHNKGSTDVSPNLTSSTEGVPVYTAEVKVVQKSSLPTSPDTNLSDSLPRHSIILEDLKMDKQNSANFNLAAKGWGTYNNFYTPITFKAS